MEKLLSNDELARFLGVPPKTLAHWRYLGKGPRFVPIGRYVRYRECDVDSWLAKQARLPGERGRSGQ